jgi:hypothetical protein
MRERWQDRWFTGHRSWGPLTIYGANAMHWAVNLRTPWGSLCIHPTTRTFGGCWPWYVYLSPNSTPWAARWGFGPGFDADDREAAKLRRQGRCHCHVSNFDDMCPVHAPGGSDG